MKHTVIVASFGLLIGGLSAFVGLSRIHEVVLWIIVGGLWFLYGVRTAVDAPMRRFAFAATLAGLLSGSMQVFFMERYKAKNPWFDDVFSTSTAQDLSTRFLTQGIAIGLIVGIVVGALVRWRLHVRVR